MNEEKYYCGAIEFWEKNKDLDSLHLLNKFMEEKYFPLDEKIKEVREWSKKLKYETLWQTTREELEEILDKENK